jgi:hypothetical protein
MACKGFFLEIRSPKKSLQYFMLPKVPTGDCRELMEAPQKSLVLAVSGQTLYKGSRREYGFSTIPHPIMNGIM